MKNLLRITSGIVTQFPLGQAPIDEPQLVTTYKSKVQMQ